MKEKIGKVLRQNKSIISVVVITAILLFIIPECFLREYGRSTVQCEG